ncbi:NAD-dependent epimerase/dehydratase family protein, partial [Ancylomarina sp. 16SWW S1-10-2]|uniref:NAD-dependent epimerase/dehydratase family protein n=1 Tax=Ancylomarina sp. 16SWW S1-10-2 TaxID=2499681 RepID=UPI0012ADB870
LSDTQVTGVKRTPIEPSLADIDCNMAWADCCDQEQMNNLMSQHAFDVVVMTFTPAEMSDQGYQTGYVDTVTTVINALKQQSHQPRLLLFVSSSSVYGQKDASWVNEESPTEPSHYSGKRLLEAEALLSNSGYPYCCVRFSGIYGPGRRRLIEQVIAG